MAASVVDLPLPVAPTTRMIPAGASHIFWIWTGICSLTISRSRPEWIGRATKPGPFSVLMKLIGGAALPVFRLALLVEHGPAEFVDGFRLNDLFADLVDGAAAPHGRDFAGGDEQVRTAGIHRILKQVDQIHEISFPGIR